MQESQKVTLRDGELYKDGRGAICPHVPPIVYPSETKLGQPELKILKTFCSLSCPLVSYSVTPEYGVYEIACGGEKVTYQVKEEAKPQPRGMHIIGT